MSFPSAGRLPVLPLKNTVIYPGMSQVVRVGRPKSLAAVEQSQRHEGFWILAVQQKNSSLERTANLDVPVEPSDLETFATLCRIDSIKGKKESGLQLVLLAFARVQICEISSSEEPYLSAEFLCLQDKVIDDKSTEKALIESLKDLSIESLKLIPGNTAAIADQIRRIEDISFLNHLIASHLDLRSEDKQRLLEINDLKEKSLFVLQLLKNFKDNLQIQNEIRNKLNQKMSESQRQGILREQLKTIREELGDSSSNNFEAKIRARLAQLELSDEVKTAFENELAKLTEAGAHNPESGMLRNYLDFATSLPWNEPETKEIDLEAARRILDEDHSGLEKVKKKILQHLAVSKLRKDLKGQILLLKGPPGVGKTSLAQSIAKALGRPYVRLSLGGVRDEAEIRGHRRTYIGAMAGRILQSMKKAGQKNPVFLLDEIDKLSRAWNGDPASALLEVLDPEQNSTFSDHYLEHPFDLSKVFFIATANSLDSIPAALLDRLEVIELSSYTHEEKLQIAEKHLIPKVLGENGINDQQLKISKEILQGLIRDYTREAGVRELQRVLSSVARGKSEDILNHGKTEVSWSDVVEILGPEKFINDRSASSLQPGVVTGLAWTPVGGEVLFIESVALPGKGQLQITGQLGDVMKESAQIAFSLFKLLTAKIAPEKDLSKFDFHVHAPAGAIPKDGPSAGVTLLTSLISLLQQKGCDSEIAMTGEISLSGQVMPVGGIKEKVLAAHRFGIKTVLIPKKNERDLVEIPQKIRDELKIETVNTVEELLSKTLGVETPGLMTLSNFDLGTNPSRPDSPVCSSRKSF
jgi:ATP-dependent Lon protease